MCLAGASWSFDRSSQHLQEFCGLRVSDNTIRHVCQEQAADMAQWQRTAHAARHAFRKASGDVEFSTDGTSVNTTEGWREMRVALFAKRQRGEPADAQSWDTRELPTPPRAARRGRHREECSLWGTLGDNGPPGWEFMRPQS